MTDRFSLQAQITDDWFGPLQKNPNKKKQIGQSRLAFSEIQNQNSLAKTQIENTLEILRILKKYKAHGILRVNSENIRTPVFHSHRKQIASTTNNANLDFEVLYHDI